jgi:hypothetical protein
MRQKNQIELNLGIGASGEAASAAAQETEARAAQACLERPAVGRFSSGRGVALPARREHVVSFMSECEGPLCCDIGRPRQVTCDLLNGPGAITGALEAN